jgi:hypothetical protein
MLTAGVTHVHNKSFFGSASSVSTKRGWWLFRYLSMRSGCKYVRFLSVCVCVAVPLRFVGRTYSSTHLVLSDVRHSQHMLMK